MANNLNRKKQISVISSLVEGNSIRSTERMTGVHRDTIMRLALRVGEGSQRLMDEKLRNLELGHIQMDEIWGYVGKKQRHIRKSDNADEVGDTWTWVALDSDTKLIPTFHVGKRTKEDAQIFVDDLASRLANRVQISADKLPAYVEAIWNSFGPEVDFAQIVKSYEAEPIGPGRYSPPKVTKVEKQRIWGKPDLDETSTSLVERQNLTMRMHIRRLTRLTNGFSKKLENHQAAISLWFGYYNFCRRHSTIETTPAVRTGVEKWAWDLDKYIGESIGA